MSLIQTLLPPLPLVPEPDLSGGPWTLVTLEKLANLRTFVPFQSDALTLLAPAGADLPALQRRFSAEMGVRLSTEYDPLRLRRAQLTGPRGPRGRSWPFYHPEVLWPQEQLDALQGLHEALQGIDNPDLMVFGPPDPVSPEAQDEAAQIGRGADPVWAMAEWLITQGWRWMPGYELSGGAPLGLPLSLTPTSPLQVRAESAWWTLGLDPADELTLRRQGWLPEQVPLALETALERPLSGSDYADAARSLAAQGQLDTLQPVPVQCPPRRGRQPTDHRAQAQLERSLESLALQPPLTEPPRRPAWTPRRVTPAAPPLSPQAEHLSPSAVPAGHTLLLLSLPRRIDSGIWTQRQAVWVPAAEPLGPLSTYAPAELHTWGTALTPGGMMPVRLITNR